MTARMPTSEDYVSRIERLGTVIDGETLTHGTTFDVIDPATERVIASVPETPLDLVDQAVQSARRAFDSGPWPRMTPEARAEKIQRLADLIEANAETLAGVATSEIGAPITLSKYLHGHGPVEFFRWWADRAARGPRGGFEERLPLVAGGPSSDSVLLKEPIGVVAGILAYNAPLMLNAYKLGGALAAGCTTVLLPSPQAPLSTIEFMRLVREAGIPDGVVNLVVGEASVGEALSSHPNVDLVSFTGSVRVGRRVMEQAAANLTKVVLELGGKSPNIILPGANLKAAALPSVMRFSRNTGQACGSTSRTLVHSSRCDEFISEVSSVLGRLRVGDPWHEGTEVGPLVSAGQRASVDGYLERASAAGAAVLASATVPEGPGYYVAPQMLGGVTNEAEVCQEELFAPVSVLLPYDDVDEAVAIAQDTSYGLNAMVWGPMEEAMPIARQLRSGTVAINGGGPERPDAPWGGYKNSGLGTERGDDGFAEFFVTKHVHWPIVNP